MVNKTVIKINGLMVGRKTIQLEGFGSIHIKDHAGESAKIDNLEIGDKSIHLLTNNLQ
jgi:hypothetical protein